MGRGEHDRDEGQGGSRARIGVGVLAGTLAWTVLVLADLLAEPTTVRHAEGVRTIVGALGLGAGVGAVQGAIFAALRSVLARLARRRATIAWSVVWIVAAVSVATRGGVWAELRGPQRGPAAILAVGLGLGALVLAILSVGPPGSASAGRRRGWIASAGFVAIVCTFGDRSLYPGEVPTIHLALRIVTAWVGMLAIDAGLFSVLASTRRVLGYTGLGSAIGVAVAGGLLDGAHRRALQAIVDRPFASDALAVWRALGDRDRDGYAAWLGGGDCAPGDPDVHPGAVEIPDNGIDDNCALGDAHAVAVDVAAVPVPESAAPMSVVLVTVDTLSAAHTSLLGHARATTPRLDAWAEGAVVFERAYTPGGWTGIAIPSLFRGVYARRLAWDRLHRTSVDEPPHPPRDGDPAPFAVFPVVAADSPPPLAAWLARRGMVTAAVVDDGATMVLSPELYTDEGFARFESMRRFPDDEMDDAQTVARARAVLAELSGGPPFFLWVHLYGPHEPSDVHPGAPDFGSSVEDRYDHEIAAADLALADLLADCDGLARPTMVVVTADHGEHVARGQRFHGTNAHEDVIHVPLVIKAPGVAPGRTHRLASLVDLVPTILAATRTPGPTGLDGVDLLAKSDDVDAPRIVLTDTWRYGLDGPRTTDIAAALDGHVEVRLQLGPRVWAAFDLRDRAAEPENRWNELDVSDLERALLDYLEHAAGP